VPRRSKGLSIATGRNMDFTNIQRCHCGLMLPCYHVPVSVYDLGHQGTWGQYIPNVYKASGETSETPEKRRARNLKKKAASTEGDRHV
jgi:hypothetical protein